MSNTAPNKARITNDFRGTTAYVLAGQGKWLSKGQIKRVRNLLCGIDGCTCGGNLSERGSQAFEIDCAGRDKIRILSK